MPESLFDDFCRNDGKPALFDEPTFGFLNRRAGAKWQRVRDLLDEWFGYVPDEAARADLRGRLRSGAEVDFRSAFFELYCHEALRRAGWGLEHHPRLAHTSRRPDLRTSRDGITAYVEVTTTSTPRLDEASQARLNTVIDMINDRMDIDQFMLGVEVLNVGNAAPATEPLCARLQEWLASLNADQLIALGSRDADDGIESLEWAQGGWRLVFEAYPLLPDRRGPGGRIIGTTRPAEAHIIDDVAPLRKRLTAKAKAYGKLDAPFVITIDAVGEFTENRDFISALYGTPAVRYYQNAGPARRLPSVSASSMACGPDATAGTTHTSPQFSRASGSCRGLPDRQSRHCGITQALTCRSTRSAPCYGTHGSTSPAGKSSTTRQR